MSFDRSAWVNSRALINQLSEPDQILLEVVDGVARAEAWWQDGATDIGVIHNSSGNTFDLGEDGRGQRPRPLPAVPPAALRNRIANRTLRVAPEGATR